MSGDGSSLYKRRNRHLVVATGSRPILYKVVRACNAQPLPSESEHGADFGLLSFRGLKRRFGHPHEIYGREEHGNEFHTRREGRTWPSRDFTVLARRCFPPRRWGLPHYRDSKDNQRNVEVVIYRKMVEMARRRIRGNGDSADKAKSPTAAVGEHEQHDHGAVEHPTALTLPHDHKKLIETLQSEGGRGSRVTRVGLGANVLLTS
ncbi:hypothetical protein BGY98DRAFT_1177765, partial [Russula aff. rugulosa BPL654]